MLRTVLLALIVALALPSVADAARQVPRGWLGVHVDGPLIEPDFAHAPAEWDRMAASGVESARTAFYWHHVQPTGPDQLDFTRTDAVVLAAARRGLGVLPVVHGTPGWAALNPGDPASPPKNPGDFARVLTALVTRYGPRGSLWAEHPEVSRQPVRSWQIWNEPNLTRYWNHAPWAPSYVALLKRAHKALNAADPRSRTILAGLPNESWAAIRAIYRAGGRRSFDVVALHPYTGKPRNVGKIARFVRRELARRGDRTKPIWITELSWPAARGKTAGNTGFETTESGQRRRLRAGLQLLAESRKQLRIARVYWYTWLSVEGITDSSFDYSGLRRVRNGQLVDAPALSMFQRLARRLQGCSKRSGDARRCA